MYQIRPFIRYILVQALDSTFFRLEKDLVGEELEHSETCKTYRQLFRVHASFPALFCFERHATIQA
jgi:hypothetical protein